MEIKFTVPTAKAVELRDYLCSKFGYSATIEDPKDQAATIPNPESKQAFARRQIMEMIQRDFHAWKNQEVRRIAQQTVVDTDLGLS